MLQRLFWAGLLALAGWAIWRALKGQEQPVAAPLEQPATWTYRPPVPPPVTRPDPVKTEAVPIVDARPAVAPPAAAQAPAHPADGLTLNIYCARCKETRLVSGAHEEVAANGRRAARGICPVCGAKVFAFLKES